METSDGPLAELCKFNFFLQDSSGTLFLSSATSERNTSYFLIYFTLFLAGAFLIRHTFHFQPELMHFDLNNFIKAGICLRYGSLTESVLTCLSLSTCLSVCREGVR